MAGNQHVYGLQYIAVSILVTEVCHKSICNEEKELEIDRKEDTST